MYSTDRSQALEYTISCLEQMPLYSKCQKTLIVDGKIDQIPNDWESIQVPRINDDFCWGRMWDAGVCSAKYEKIFYLDSDRLLSKSFLKLIDEHVADDVFLFTSKHFMMKNKISVGECKKALLEDDLQQMFIKNPDISSFLQYETRHEQPFHGPGKNVMSGSTAFTRDTYLKLGGVDQWYCGHGAFADSDFHMQAACAGCSFLDLGTPELHFPHEKLDNQNTSLTDKQIWKLSLDNFIYYCIKWKLPIALAESFAVRCEIKKPSSYVNKKAKEIKANAKVFFEKV